jgi:hypothetical protein
MIESRCRIDAVVPLLFSGKERFSRSGRIYLNNSRVDVVQPLQGSRYWGEGFPRLAAYLDKLFDDGQRAVFLQWLSHFYQSALKRDLRKGQALYVAGPIGVGKTCLSELVIGGLMGGSAEATNFLLGRTEFNAELFENPVWRIDDAQASAGGREHDLYTNLIKKAVANTTHSFRAMYTNPATIEWCGRVIVTLNDDANSIQMLPDLDQSTRDKVIFLKAGDASQLAADVRHHLDSELPAFAAYLRDYAIPEDRADSRFGVRAFQHAELTAIAHENSRAGVFAGILEEYRELQGRVDDRPVWIFSALELKRALDSCESLKLDRGEFRNANQVGKNLRQLVQRRVAWLRELPRHPTAGVRYEVDNPCTQRGRAA